MGVRNAMSAPGVLVEKFINTAYDDVKKVADELEAVTALSDIIEDVTTVALLGDEVTRAADGVDDFNNTYYGSLAEEPTTRPDGSASQDGDLYKNSSNSLVYIFNDTLWESIGQISVSVEKQTIVPGNLDGTDVNISLVTPYTVGNNSLAVYINGINMTGKYTELGPNNIQFINNVDIILGDEVLAVVGTLVSTVDPTIQVTSEYYVTTGAAEQAIVLPNGMTYQPNSQNLEVYVDGVYQFVNIGYTETTNNSINLAEPVDLGTELAFKSGHLLTTLSSSEMRESVNEYTGDSVVTTSVCDTDPTSANIVLTLPTVAIAEGKTYTLTNRSGTYNSSFLVSPLDTGVYIFGATSGDTDTQVNNTSSNGVLTLKCIEGRWFVTSNTTVLTYG